MPDLPLRQFATHASSLGLLAGAARRALVLVLMAGTAHAATIDFTGAGSAGGGYGNSLAFSSGGLSVTAWAFAETGAATGTGFYLFETAEIYSWSTGMGICNRQEGLAHTGCGDDEHEMDTAGRDDLLVLIFNQRVNFHSLKVDPYDGPGSDPNDRDIVYRTGDLAGLPGLASYSFDSLGAIAGMGGEVLSAAISSYSPFTHALTGAGNALFISGNHADRNCVARNVRGSGECEAYKIRGISVSPAGVPTVVPVPGAAWLMGSALIGLGIVRRPAAR